MRTYKDIAKQITKLRGMECLRQPAASVEINAPLAIMQIEYLAKLNTLEWLMQTNLTKLPNADNS